VSQSDLEIAQLVYDGTPRTPLGFFKEASADESIIATTHIKNTDIDTTLAAPMPQYELCSDDWNQALSWSETTAAQGSTYADLVDSKSTAQFFEFDRVRPGDPVIAIKHRVFKCAYVDRSTADIRSPEGSAGQLNQRPLTSEELKLLAEYLWQFTSYNNAGHVVLKSSGATNTNMLMHTVYIANVMHAGVSANCDRIEVIAWRHTANTTTGELTLDVEPLFNFGARPNAGAAALCSE
jgi:hypothetical protein